MPEQRKRILFVDDEPRILRGLRRSLRGISDDWDIEFANCSTEALAMLAQKPFDVIVSDMRMPGMDGSELLNEVRARYPHMIRLALSGEASKEMVLNSIGPIHQYLPKPCDIESLKTTLWRLCALQNLLGIEKLQSMLTELEGLPSMPSMYHALLAEFESPDGSIKRVGHIVSQDLGMSSKVLQLVNSSFFGIPRKVTCPSEAAIALGMETIRALAIAVCVFTPLEQRMITDLSIEPLWNHSLAVGTMSRQIAQAAGADAQTVDEAFVAGLLHDVGMLTFTALMPDAYRKVHEIHRSQGTDINQAERQELEATHCEVGAYLLGLWGFSNAVVQATAYHHEPQKTLLTGFSAVTAVHIADTLARETESSTWLHSKNEIDMAYLEDIECADALSGWKEACSREEVPTI